MTQYGSVTRLAHDLRDPAAREQAARRIWDRYFTALLALARAHLDARVRRREDEHDVLQSMYQSFCRRQGRGDFDLANRDQLWALLVTITVRKARSAAQRHRCKARDVRREQTEGDDPRENDLGAPGWLERVKDADPTPAEAGLLSEALERLLEALADSGLRHFALRKLEWFTNREVADELGVTERSVERKVQMIRNRWEVFGGASAGP
jgi:DNA-directed RNA polymerase specialized sigma24 family protein